jgi:hypothetical protein
VTNLQAELCRFEILARETDFIFPNMSRPAMRSIQPPVQSIPEALSPVVQWLGHELTVKLHVMSKLRICDTTSPLHLHVFIAYTGTTTQTSQKLLSIKTQNENPAIQNYSCPLIKISKR